MEEAPKNLQELLKTAQEMQQQVTRVQEGLAKQEVEGTAGGGMVTAVANGKQELISVKIERDIVDPDEIEMLQDLVVAAVNQALAKAGELAREEMSKAAGGFALQIPGLTP